MSCEENNKDEYSIHSPQFIDCHWRLLQYSWWWKFSWTINPMSKSRRLQEHCHTVFAKRIKVPVFRWTCSRMARNHRTVKFNSLYLSSGSFIWCWRNASKRNTSKWLILEAIYCTSSVQKLFSCSKVELSRLKNLKVQLGRSAHGWIKSLHYMCFWINYNEMREFLAFSEIIILSISVMPQRCIFQFYLFA